MFRHSLHMDTSSGVLNKFGGKMINIIVHLSKIIMVGLLGLFVGEGFLCLKEKSLKKRNIRLKSQRIYFFVLQLCAHLTIFAVKQEIKYLLLYALQAVVFIMLMLLYDHVYVKASKLVINNMCMLTMVGLFMLERLNFDKALKQFLFFTVAIVVCSFIPVLIEKLPKLQNFAWVYAIIGITLLSVVLAIATVSHGAKLSVSIGPITIQPSEFVKITYVFFVASMLYKNKTLKNIIVTTIIAAVHVLVLVASRDLGAALIFFVAYMMMVFVATKDFRYLAVILSGGVAASIGAYYMFSHVRVRVLAWKDPFSVIDGAGYQVTQSLFAIGTGGWFGSGLYQGLPNAIPVVEKDFIFSAIAEELGLVFAILLLLVCICCFLMFLNIAMRIRNSFYKLVALGLGVVYGVQVFLTVGGATKFIPSTGVTLPLVSYGGSSLLSTVMIFSIIQGLYILREDEGEEIARKRKEKAKNGRKKKEK